MSLQYTTCNGFTVYNMLWVYNIQHVMGLQYTPCNEFTEYNM